MSTMPDLSSRRFTEKEYIKFLAYLIQHEGNCPQINIDDPFEPVIYCFMCPLHPCPKSPSIRKKKALKRWKNFSDSEILEALL